MSSKLVFVLSFLIILGAHAEKNFREAGLTKAFVPQLGFDSNDNVQITIVGELPHPCWELSKSKLFKNDIRKEIEVMQFMRKKSSPGCEQISQNKKWRVQFSKTLSVGELVEGEWKVKYKNSLLDVAERGFSVRAPLNPQQIDDRIYAPVTSAFIPEIVYTNQEVKVILSGILPDKCVQLKQETKVDQLGDVFIILPEMTMTVEDCGNKQRPLQKIISLGKLKPGQYLLHVRSLTGHAINRTFKVVKRLSNPAGYLLP